MVQRCVGEHKGPIQQFTATCQACGRNIYETDTEYEAALDDALAKQGTSDQQQRIREKESRLRKF